MPVVTYVVVVVAPIAAVTAVILVCCCHSPCEPVEAVLNDIKKVSKLRTAEKSKAASAKTRPKKDATLANAAPQHPVFEHAGKLATKLPSFPETDLTEFCLDEPALLNFENETLTKLYGPDVKLCLGQIKKVFKQNSGAQTRAEVALDLSVIQQMAKELTGKFHPCALFYLGKADSIPTDTKELTMLLHKNLLATGFAIAANQATFASEKLFLPCVRFASERVRTVVLFPYEKLVDYLNAIKGTDQPDHKLMDPQTKQAVTQFLKFCNGDKLKELVDKTSCKFFVGMVHATEAIYIPAGWIFAELSKELCLGIKAPLLVDAAGTRAFFEKAKTCDGEAMSDQSSIATGYLQATAKA